MNLLIDLTYVCFRWTERDECIGGCGGHSTCDDGVCVCNHRDCEYLYLCSSNHLLLQPTSRRTAAASGTRRRPSSETRRSTASRHRRPGRSGATARTRAATRRCAASTETSRTARCHPTPTSLITTTNSAGDYHLCSYSWKNIII